MQVSQVLSGVRGSSFVSINTKTVPVLAGGKKNPMQGRVTKVMEGANGQVFTNTNVNGYENKVNRRLTAEGKEAFQLSPRVWGSRIENTPFVEYKNNLYLEMIMSTSGKISYLLDGKPIAKADIIGLKDKAEGDQGGLDEKVIVRTFAEDSITQIKINGQVFN